MPNYTFWVRWAKKPKYAQGKEAEAGTASLP